MKAITVTQPWAQLLVCGAKVYDTRTWQTSHRGPLLIHAAKRLSEATRALCAEEPFRSLLKAHGVTRAIDLPLGALIGTVELIDCIDTDALFPNQPGAQATGSLGEARRLRSGLVSDLELALGDFRPGRWAWKMANSQSLKEPIPYKGALGMFEVDVKL